jgi:C4-dicarboxylate-binding protein DctP
MRWIPCALAGVVVVAAVTSAQAEPEYIIQFSHVVAETTPKGKAANLLAKLINERLAGQVRMDVYPNSQLYDDNKVMEAMRLASGKTGIMAAPSLSKFVRFSRQLQAFDLPFLFHDLSEVHKLQDSPLAAKFTEGIQRRSLHALGFWDNGMKVFSIRGDRPLIRVPNDFRGKKFRIQTSDVHAAIIEALGGVPQKLPFKEVYTALGQGVVDGQENTWSNIYSKKFYEVQDYITVSDHGYLGYLLVVSDAFWKGLPADIRKALTEILREVTNQARVFAQEFAGADRQRIADSGTITIVELTPEQRAQWVEATKPVEKRFRRKIGNKLMTEIHQLLGH